MKKLIKKYSQTPLGSFVKVFLFAMLVFTIEAFVNDKLVFPVKKDFWMACVKAGVIATLPTIYNYINPNYKNYGVKKVEPLKADRTV